MGRCKAAGCKAADCRQRDVAGCGLRVASLQVARLQVVGCRLQAARCGRAQSTQRKLQGCWQHDPEAAGSRLHIARLQAARLQVAGHKGLSVGRHISHSVLQGCRRHDPRLQAAGCGLQGCMGFLRGCTRCSQRQPQGCMQPRLQAAGCALQGFRLQGCRLQVAGCKGLNVGMYSVHNGSSNAAASTV